MALSDGFHVGDHAEVTDDRRIHEFNSCALAEGGTALLRDGVGHVVGDGGIEAEGEVRLDLEGGGLGPAQADFLLDGEDAVEIVCRLWVTMNPISSKWAAAMVFFLAERPFFEGDHVAHVVHGDFVGEALKFGEDQVADFLFVAGGVGFFAE